MATKPVTISPNEAVAAGCTATCVSWLHDLDLRVDVYYYQISATAAAGWELDYIAWDLDLDGNPDRTDSFIVYNKSPIPETQRTGAEYAGDLLDGWDYNMRHVYTLFNVKAHFKRQHTPTHLLVNYATRESPAKLVYDPATNRLVADY